MTSKSLFCFILLFLGFFQFTSAQVLEPVTWASETEQLSENEWLLSFTATIEDGWYMYSQEETEGPLPTYFEFQNQDRGYELVGTTSEPTVAPKYDNIFEMDVKKFEGFAVFKQKIKVTNPDINQFQVMVDYQVCDDEKCIPADYTFSINLSGTEPATSEVAALDEKSKMLSQTLDINVTGWDKFKEETMKEKTYLSIFFLGFLGGLIALLTPCVFPMIPLTVSFFTKSGQGKKKGTFNSVMYGFFIFLIYVLLSLPFHLLDTLDPEILNNISTNVTLNVLFFVIFLVFAFSFFGYFELTLPASWSNALDSKANSIGGIIGIFFMAITLAIVSFSCTGPILGTLLGSSLSSDAGAMQLTLGMSGFGLALALPFSLFAMFPNWLNSLPKSGGWLNTVKVVLGFIELALALKFLSNADLVEHWGLLKREVFIGLWILIGLGLFLYLVGKIKFPHDGPIQKLSKGRWLSAAITLMFVIYLIPGLTKSEHANLKLLSGFPPPMFYSIYEQVSDCPLGLNCYKDYDSGLAAAKAANKPIMFDFTGWACVNCRKMEEQVWSTSEVYDLLNEEFIIISLYVDDRTKMPEDEQFQYRRPNGTLKTIKTIGDKWGTFQTINFQNNSQPYYVLVNHEMELLNTTTAYTPNADAYFDWLQTGLNNFK